MFSNYKVPMQNAKKRPPAEYGKSKDKEKRPDYSERRRQKRGD